jgi:hypothetical protein
VDDTTMKIDALLQTIKSHSVQEFLKSLLAGHEKYGRLTAKQQEALDKFWERRDRGKIKKLGLDHI